MKPREMSEWIAPAASTAAVSAGTDQARHSSSPTVKKLIRPSRR
jgi:hypothetical protein